MSPLSPYITVSKAYREYIYQIVMVVMATRLEQNKFNWNWHFFVIKVIRFDPLAPVKTMALLLLVEWKCPILSAVMNI